MAKGSQLKPRRYLFYLTNAGDVVGTPKKGGHKDTTRAKTIAEARQTFDTRWFKDSKGRFTDPIPSAFPNSHVDGPRIRRDAEAATKVGDAIVLEGLDTSILDDVTTEASITETQGDLNLKDVFAAAPTPVEATKILFHINGTTTIGIPSDSVQDVFIDGPPGIIITFTTPKDSPSK